jgi:hypothetical protein
MLPLTLPFSVRRFGVRSFRDRELEHEFRQVFRSAGVRFFEIGALLGGLAYFAFFVIYAIGRTDAAFAQPQPLRVVMFVVFLSASCLARGAKTFVSRHYDPFAFR